MKLQQIKEIVPSVNYRNLNSILKNYMVEHEDDLLNKSSDSDSQGKFRRGVSVNLGAKQYSKTPT